jgi:hypothetical protein
MNLNFGRFAVSDMRPTPEVGGAISSKIQGHHRPTDASKWVKRVTLPEKVDEIPPFHDFSPVPRTPRTPCPYRSMDYSTPLSGIVWLTSHSSRHALNRQNLGLIGRHGATSVGQGASSGGGGGFVTERLRGPRTHSMSAVVALAFVPSPRSLPRGVACQGQAPVFIRTPR